MSSKEERQAARERLRQARQDLADLPDTGEEDDEYLRRNQAVIDAEQGVPWIFR